MRRKTKRVTPILYIFPAANSCIFGWTSSSGFGTTRYKGSRVGRVYWSVLSTTTEKRFISFPEKKFISYTRPMRCSFARLSTPGLHEI